MALTEEDLRLLPPALQQAIRAQASAPPATGDMYGMTQLMQNLQGQTGRMFEGDFDPSYDATIRNLMSELASRTAGYEQGEQRSREDLEIALRDLTKGHGRNLEKNEVSFADRGLLRSGMNLEAQGRLGELYQRGAEGVSRSTARRLSDIAAQRQAAYGGIQSQASQAEADATARASQRMQERRWMEEQNRLEGERAQRQEEFARQQMEQQNQYLAEQQNRLAQMEADLLAAQQPYPDQFGSYEPMGDYGGGGEGGGGGPGPVEGLTGAATTVSEAVQGLFSGDDEGEDWGPGNPYQGGRKYSQWR